MWANQQQYYKQQGRHMLRLFVLALFIGFIAGVSGGIVGSSLYTNQLLDQQPNSPYITYEPAPKQGLDIDRLNQVQLGLVSIFEKKRGMTSDFLQQAYSKEEALGYAVALTSDGMLFMPSSIELNATKQYVGMTPNRQFYDIQQIQLDAATKTQFGKLAAHEEKPPIQLTPITLIDRKQSVNKSGTVYSIIPGGAVKSGYLQSTEYFHAENKQDYVISSEEMRHLFYVDNMSSNNQLLFDERLNLIGVAYDKKHPSLYMPVYAVKNAIAQVLKQEQIKRAYLGVDYIDLSMLHTQSSFSQARGAYLYVSNRYGIDANSPARKALLQGGDIITRINGQVINSATSLSELLLDFFPGDQIRVEFVRNGQVQEVEIILAQLPS